MHALIVLEVILTAAGRNGLDDAFLLVTHLEDPIVVRRHLPLIVPGVNFSMAFLQPLVLVRNRALIRIVGVGLLHGLQLLLALFGLLDLLAIFIDFHLTLRRTDSRVFHIRSQLSFLPSAFCS